MKIYKREREGQMDFFDKFGIDYLNNDVLIDNTDGVWKGNLLEFKLNLSNINRALCQAIKYLSKMRIKGESVPANIILVGLNSATAYIFESKDYFKEIHQVYYGAASKNNEMFVASTSPLKLKYNTQMGAFQLKTKLQECDFLPIKLDENCIVGWAERYYREYPDASKGDFLGDDDTSSKTIGEIREPRLFKGLILPYKNKSNEKFKYLMDKLNDRLHKKDLGAFYTPKVYCEKAKELLEIAIKRVPKGNDYVILDRCAGTGNLEEVLTNEQLSHCILSTYEYYEYKVLCERLGDKVRTIIPPVEMEDTYDRGFVKCADALSKEYVDNPIIKEYINNPKCSIILLENPPYRDDTSGMTGIKSKNKKVDSYVLEQMKSAGVKKTNELANRFIWSGFNYYLRQESDSYILFCPIKYWKIDKLINREFIKGFLFNKKYFHASPSAISCILWGNKHAELGSLILEAYDIVDDKAEYCKQMTAYRVHKEITRFFENESTKHEVIPFVCNTNGHVEQGGTSLYDREILGYFVGRGFGISNPNLNFNLVRLKFSDNHGFYLTEKNYYSKLPLFAIKHYLMFCRKWVENEFICCSADGGTEYIADKEFLRSCFIFACLDYYNKCLSIMLKVNGKEQIIQNQLCFDRGTIAKAKLDTLKLNNDEKTLVNLYNKMIFEASKVPEYNPKFTYGTYQVQNDLNKFDMDENGQKIYRSEELNTAIETLRKKTNEYFDKFIKEKLFKYQLVK